METKQEDKYCICDPSCLICNFDINFDESICLRCNPALFSGIFKPVILGSKCLNECPPGFKR